MSESVPSPALCAQSDGRHTAVCPACGEEVDVAVTNVPAANPADIGGFFVTKRDPATGAVLERVVAETAEYDFSAFEQHWARHA